MAKLYVPLTGSQQSMKTVTKSISLAKVINFEVVVINVIDTATLNKLNRYKVFIAEEAEMFGDSMQKDAEKYLNYAAKIGLENGVKVQTVLLHGDPYPEIMNFIKNDEESIKIICVSKKSGGELLKDRLSDIERKIILNTPYDVIIFGEDK